MDIRIKQTPANIHYKIYIPSKESKKNVLKIETNVKDYRGSLSTNNNNKHILWNLTHKVRRVANGEKFSVLNPCLFYLLFIYLFLFLK